MTTTRTAATDLQHIATNWPLLRELLQTATPATWPPAMGLQHHLDQQDTDTPAGQRAAERAAEREAAAHALAATERAERTDTAPGRRPAPLRVATLDLLAELETELLDLADAIASNIQRPAFTIHAANPHDLAARQIALATARIAETDRTDPRRWQFRQAEQRTGATAAAWLADRIATPGGPFRLLSDQQRTHIGLTAAAVRRRLDRALGNTGATQTALDHACACGGQLEMLAGGDSAPVIRCTRCGEFATFPGAVA